MIFSKGIKRLGINMSKNSITELRRNYDRIRVKFSSVRFRGTVLRPLSGGARVVFDSHALTHLGVLSFDTILDAGLCQVVSWGWWISWAGR